MTRGSVPVERRCISNCELICRCERRRPTRERKREQEIERVSDCGTEFVTSSFTAHTNRDIFRVGRSAGAAAVHVARNVVNLFAILVAHDRALGGARVGAEHDAVLMQTEKNKGVVYEKRTN